MTTSNGGDNAPTTQELIGKLVRVSGIDSKLDGADLVYILHTERKLTYKQLKECGVRYTISSMRTYNSVAGSIPYHERPDDPKQFLTLNHLRKIAPVANHNKALALTLVNELLTAHYENDGLSHDNPDDPQSAMDADRAFFAKVASYKVEHGITDPPTATEVCEFWDVPKAEIERTINQLQDVCETVKVENETLSAMPDDGKAYLKLILVVPEESE